ncbi:MAG TPA: 16S rRNA (uracil(1498)-N(3))-methyltransferase [Jiangellales bacterium]|nr:16S rRNA (uracil(1498)-N(3))-methyltransferase [Jiangellales bacterium]
MSLPVFLVEPGSLDGATTVQLGAEEGRHAAVVRRIRAGEQVELSDGRGAVARCEVESASRAGLTCRVLGLERHPAPSPRLVVVQAVPKGDRGELAVEVLTEVGVDEVVPWSAARCVARWDGDRAAKGLRRWRSVAREAAKQARRPWLPAVTDLASTRAVAARLAAADLALVLHEDAESVLATVRPPDSGEVVVVVGPEGGVTPEELDAFAAAGALAVRLGPSVLRTSTAGAVATGVLLARTPRWG